MTFDQFYERLKNEARRGKYDIQTVVKSKEILQEAYFRGKESVGKPDQGDKNQLSLFGRRSDSTS